MKIRAWRMKKELSESNDVYALEADLHHDSYQWVDIKELEDLGVLCRCLEGDTSANNDEADKICKERNYSSND